MFSVAARHRHRKMRFIRLFLIYPAQRKHKTNIVEI